jgi:steroid 5-alpha reductase family enzyme
LKSRGIGRGSFFIYNAPMWSSLLETYQAIVPVIFLYMTALFLVAQARDNNSIVDVGWGLGFIVIALYTLWANPYPTFSQLLVTTLTLIWGLRLAWHIGSRNWGKGEDWRYRQWRNEWMKRGEFYFDARSFLQVFMLQGILMIIVATPIILINTTTYEGISLSAILGLSLWLIGFGFEAIGDYQKSQFKQQPGHKHKLYTDGLWQYTRHPNYFGEATLWWGLALIAVPGPLAWLAFLGPITINGLLLKVSGIPMLEKRYAGDPAFEAYKKRTNAFFPGPPKSSS